MRAVSSRALKKLVAILAVLLVVAPVAALVGKVGIYAVVTDSMKPQINPGDLVVVAPSPVYKVGDVVAARVGGKVYVHRVVGIDGEAGVYYIRGDNAYNIDYVDPESVVGRVIAHIPLLGYMVIYKPLALLMLALAMVVLYRKELRHVGRRGGLALLPLLLALAPMVASAGGGITVVSDYPFPVRILADGRQYIVDSTLPISTTGKLCLKGPLVYYESQESRLAFKGFLVDGALVEGRCVEPGPQSRVEPYYVREILVTVSSRPPGVFEERLWVAQGSVVTLEVPSRVERGMETYTLEGVRGAYIEDGRLIVIADSPREVVVEYSRYVKVLVGGETLTLPEGSSFIVDLEDLIKPGGEGVRLVPEKLVYAGKVYDVMGLKSIVLVASSPGEVEALYTPLYLVRVHTAEGVVERWVREGDTVTLLFKSEIQQGPSSKLVLAKIIDNNITLYTWNVSITVDRPHYIRAVYDKYYLVTVSSVLGERQAWVKAGDHYTVSFPARLEGFLTYYSLEGVMVGNTFKKPGAGGTIEVYVDGPKRVTAVYVKKADIANLVLVSTPIAVVTAAAILYIYENYLREESHRPSKSPGGGQGSS